MACCIVQFNKPKSSLEIFLMSTRAGGLGINLTSSDTVVIFDSDWNPQMDLQAMARAHRIGQTREVTVYRLTTEGTIEEHISNFADAKLMMASTVLQDGLSADGADPHQKEPGELLRAIRFGADKVLKMGDADGHQAVDITHILARAEDAQHNAADFSLAADSSFSCRTFQNQRYPPISLYAASATR